MSTGTDSEYVRALVKGFITENYVDLAILTVFLYDAIAYFADEVKYFWAKPRSVVSILYFLNRYGSILLIATELLTSITNANETVCRIGYVPAPVAVICGDYILFLRVRALYAQGRLITRLLLIAFGLEALILVGFAVYQSILLDPSVFEVDGFSLCFGNALPLAEDIAIWSIPLAYGTLLMVLALYKAGQFWKESAGFEGLDLVKVLIRDQAFYFVAANVVCIANILGSFIPINSFVGSVLSAFGSPGLLSIIGSRFLLNMKVAGEKGLNQGISYSLQSITSNIEFAVYSDDVAETSLGNTAESLEAEIQDTA